MLKIDTNQSLIQIKYVLLVNLILASAIIIGSLTLSKQAMADTPLTSNTIEFSSVPPQIVAVNIIPVIEMLLDTSHSMQWLAGPEGYQPDEIVTHCPEDITLPGEQNNPDSQVILQFDDQGNPYFIYSTPSTSGTSLITSRFEWGTTPNTTGPAGYPLRCFHTASLYDAIMSTTNTKELTWTGNELNYAFLPDPNYPTNSNSTSLKNMISRLEAVQEATISIVNQMDNSPIHLGISQLNWSKKNESARGAKLLVYPDIVANNKNELINNINNMVASGNTPLASAHAQIQRFMVEGHNEPLEYNGQTEDAYDILSNQPINNAASPIENTCSQPNLIMLTDGLPYNDKNVPSGLLNITSNLTHLTQLARVANFSANTDLRPDLDGTQSMPTFLVVFANQILYDSATVIETAQYGGRYYASDAQGLINIFQDIINTISTQSGSIGVPAFASQVSDPDNMVCYNKYNAAKWSGDVACYPLNDVGKITTDPIWMAKEQLATIDPKERVMITYNNGGIPFIKLDDLNQQMQEDLNFDGQGQLRMDILRNFNEDNNPNFRDLPFVSDILGGELQYIGEAIGGWDIALQHVNPSLADEYKVFVEQSKQYPAIVCSGSNNPAGRQCFDAKTGDEKLAYLPGSTTRISDFLKLNYSHSSFNSGPSVVEDVVINGIWKTLYVFCGGDSPDKQCSALDVTTREFSQNDAGNLVLWEVNNSQIEELGNIITIPSMILHSTTNGENSTMQSLTLLPNGYNSTANKACLIAIDNRKKTTWTRNSDYFVICDNKEGDTALSVRAVDSTRDGMADHLYLTTANGRILRIDNLDQSPNSWRIDAEVANLGQPITSKPLVVKPLSSAVGINKNTSPNLIVLVGTGRFLEEDDRTNTEEQYFVSILDDGSGSATLSDLVEQKLVEFTINGNSLLLLTDKTVDFGSHRGAFIRLKNGDRVIDPPQLYNNYVTFNIITPGQYNEDCDGTTNGSSKFVIADTLSLSRPDEPLFDITDNHFVDTDDLINAADVNLPDDITIHGETFAPAGHAFPGEGIFSAQRIIGNYLFENSDVATTTGFGIEIITLAPIEPVAGGRRSWQELRQH